MLIDKPDYEWLMIDATPVKVHAQAAGARGGNQAMGRTKRGQLHTSFLAAVRIHCIAIWLKIL